MTRREHRAQRRTDTTVDERRALTRDLARHGLTWAHTAPPNWPVMGPVDPRSRAVYVWALTPEGHYAHAYRQSVPRHLERGEAAVTALRFAITQHDRKRDPVIDLLLSGGPRHA